MEVNNYESCNNGVFNLRLIEFYFIKEDDMGVATVEVYYNEEININEKLGEMVGCEFCHDEIDYISIMRI